MTPNLLLTPCLQADSRDFLDKEESEERMFERDWQRACSKEKFTGMLSRENKANKTNQREDKIMLQDVHDVLLQHYKAVREQGGGVGNTGQGQAGGIFCQPSFLLGGVGFQGLRLNPKTEGLQRVTKGNYGFLRV